MYAALLFETCNPSVNISARELLYRLLQSPLRLPVPPSRRFVEVLDANFAFYFVAIPNDKCETVLRKCVSFRRFPQLLVPACETLYRRFSGSEPIAKS
jgi:hypothetical protein